MNAIQNHQLPNSGSDKEKEKAFSANKKYKQTNVSNEVPPPQARPPFTDWLGDPFEDDVTDGQLYQDHSANKGTKHFRP